MHPRPGFARLLPVLAVTGLVAGIIALLASARPVQAPQRITANPMVAARWDGGCSDVPAPVPAHGVVDAFGRRWELADLPNRVLEGLDLSGAEWTGVDLHSAILVNCNFRWCDLRGADLRWVQLWACDFTDADLTGADLGGVWYDRETRWPVGFQSAGPRLTDSPRQPVTNIRRNGAGAVE